MRDSGKGNDVVSRLILNSGGDDAVIIACLAKLIEAEQWAQSADVIGRYKAELSSNPEFQAAWANLIIRQSNPEEAKRFIESKDFRPAILQTTRPALYARLLRVTGNKEELNAMLRSLIDPALASRDEREIMDLARLAAELGRQDLFTERVRELMPPLRADRLLNSLSFLKDTTGSWR